MIRGLAYLPDARLGPGRLDEVVLEAAVTGPAELTLPEVTVRDERGGELLCGSDLVFAPMAGGGPLTDAEADRQARAFGIVNTAYHAQRMFRLVCRLLETPLPRLVVRIGVQCTSGRWGGGHYRLPGSVPTPDEHTSSVAGEVHLGGGCGFIRAPGGRYFHAPAHNAAIVCHEVGHHMCRHTADFRVNGLRDRFAQHSGKVALDEGTADFLTAVLLSTPDIYGWQRGHLAPSDPRRRRLDARRTMAALRPRGCGSTHANGTIWASALWSSRERLLANGADSDSVTRALLLGLVRLGSGRAPKERRRRKQFSALLRAISEADAVNGPQFLAAMAEHGILPEGTNAELRDRCRRLSALAVSP
ncbi:hypothetical protein [Allokutzneria albata]|uniref:Uncharacterized protein n=1 Tax=Allokutzneria albata TaxID=211114 RepID=A0A1G9SMH5_ALLAB|nr:hypothetical protein [Allokutzneria albata]SDM36631.1 hypothetical protein SAMN04489726_1268 [Allokutzneria albata]